MFHHVKELQFNARVSGADPRFARLLLDQFGGANGELKAAMQYFVQAFSARQPYPEKYDLLMDIATEEFSHLEIVGATITMLLNGINGELKDAAERSELMQILNSKASREELIHSVSNDPHFMVLSAGGPVVTDSHGVPWSGMYVNANGDLTVDLRSNIAAESRAKIVYEYLMQYTDDPLVHETLRFLMTREVSHFQMFHAALESITPNFPPGVLQGDPRYTHMYFNMSNGADVRGPWNQGQGPWDKGEHWVYVQDPVDHVHRTEGLIKQPIEGAAKSQEEVEQKNIELSQMRSNEVLQAVGAGGNQWSAYSDEPAAQTESPRRKGKNK